MADQHPLFSVMIQNLSVSQLSQNIYTDPLYATAIYALLNGTTQQVIDDLIFVKGPIPFPYIRTLHTADEKSAWNKALLTLKQLNIIQGKGQELWLNETFQQSLIKGIASDARLPYDSLSRDITNDDSIQNWESLLHSMTENSRRIDKTVLSLLTCAGLLKGSQVTRSGFQFLVQPRSIQLWTVLAEWLRSSKAIVEDTCILLSIVRLSPGAEYRQFQKISLLSSVGLFRICGEKFEFCATHLIKSLLSCNDQAGSDLRIVVETNYHMYAYSPSPLSIAILSLFVSLKDRLPNMLRARLTQTSIRSAFRRGITADQLLTFLHTNSLHPLPPTLVDQIKLWEADLRRVRDRQGFLYSQFLQASDFDVAVQSAGAANVLYSNRSNRLLVVSEGGHEVISKLFK